MKATRFITSIIIGMIALTLTQTFTSCTKEEPVEGIYNGSTPYVTTPVNKAPEVGEDALPFIIVPESGWTINQTDLLFFRAYALIDGKYVDVTYDTNKTKWDFSYTSGMMVHGDDPGLIDGQEIVIKCVYDKKYPAQSIGYFHLDKYLEETQNHNE